jgi:hypothetical protein
MSFWVWVAVVVHAILAAADTGVVPAVPPGLIGGESFKVLSSLLEPTIQTRVLDHLGHEAENAVAHLPCGYFCDADAAAVQQTIAKRLEYPLRQLGDIKLTRTDKVLPSHHESWAAVAIIFLDDPTNVVAPALINADDTKVPLTLHGPWQGTAVVMSAAFELNFASKVTLAIVPMLWQPRPVADFYIGSFIWQALVSTHRGSGFLGLKFFRGHFKYPVYWHAIVWSGLGAALLTLLAIPFLYGPLHRLALTIEKRLGYGKTEGDVRKTENMVAAIGLQQTQRNPVLLGRVSGKRLHSAKLPSGSFHGDNDHRAHSLSHGCVSPMTPGTKQISLQL